MSTDFTTYISSAVFTLFGSRERIEFNENKSVYDNFISMCSLPCYKRDSEATLKLKKIIEEHNFTFDKKLNDVDRYSYAGRERRINAYISKLETIQGAINEWRLERIGFSERCGLMNSFVQGLTDFVRKMRSNTIEQMIDCSM